MFTLAIEISSAIGSVALLEEDECLAEKNFSAAARHSGELLPAIQELLAEAKIRAEQIDLWAVGLGPGSFTGIRVGIAAVQGFALATGKPVVGVPSFHAIALEHLREQPLLDVTLDAGQGEFYFAHYERGISILETPIQLIAAKELQPNTPALQRPHAPIPYARFVAQLGRQKFLHQRSGDEKLEPIYLRATKFVKAQKARI